MIPIDKNIIVVDEYGTVYNSTWLKRANGLVKKGRARWLDGQTISLMCPPEQMEDNRMENLKCEENETECIIDTEGEKALNDRLGGLTIENLLDRMNDVRKEMISMNVLLSTMKEIAIQADEDDATHIAEATRMAFIARETSYQQQFRFLEKIYDDYFSVPSEETNMNRTRIILNNINEVIPSLDYSDENGSGSIEALKVLKEMYSDLLRKILNV